MHSSCCASAFAKVLAIHVAHLLVALPSSDAAVEGYKLNWVMPLIFHRFIRSSMGVKMELFSANLSFFVASSLLPYHMYSY